jgi:hypothetical protein
MKCGSPDIVPVGLRLAKIPKTSSLHAAAASLRSMDPKLLTWELVANRLVAEHKTQKVPKPGNNLKSKKRREGRTKSATKMILLLMKRLIARTLRNLHALSPCFCKAEKCQSIAIFVERQAIEIRANLSGDVMLEFPKWMVPHWHFTYHWLLVCGRPWV